MTSENEALWDENLAIEHELEAAYRSTGAMHPNTLYLLSKQERLWHQIIVNHREPPTPRTHHNRQAIAGQPA